MKNPAFGIGTDIEEVKKFAQLLKAKNGSWKKFYSKNELEYSLNKTKPEIHLAARFAGKEAVIKALTNLGYKLKLSEIEVVHGSNNSPVAVLPRRLVKKIDVHITLSHTIELAIAFAFASKKS